MEIRQITQQAAQKQETEQDIEQWRNVPGDIDDFIFFHEDFCESER